VTLIALAHIQFGADVDTIFGGIRRENPSAFQTPPLSRARIHGEVAHDSFREHERQRFVELKGHLIVAQAFQSSVSVRPRK
jgi:hypothetical protein